MKAIKLLTVLAAAVMFTGCAGLHSLTSPSISNAPNVSLSQNNFHVVKHVQCSETTTYICGIGGLSQKALTQNAVADMIKKANLTGPQTVINITTKVTRKAFTPLYIQFTATASGTVVEFDNPSFDYSVNLTDVAKEEVAKNKTYIPASLTPLSLCQTGEIRDLSKNEQKAILGMLADELLNDMKNARTLEYLKEVKVNLETVKTYYGLMSKGTQKNVDKLTESLNKKIAKFSK